MGRSAQAVRLGNRMTCTAEVAKAQPGGGFGDFRPWPVETWTCGGCGLANARSRLSCRYCSHEGGPIAAPPAGAPETITPGYGNCDVRAASCNGPCDVAGGEGAPAGPLTSGSGEDE